jgi:hypothetical protein
MSLVGDRSGRRFGLGDQLRVKLIDVQPAVGKIDLELVSAKSARKGSAGREPRRRRRGEGA